MLTSLHLCALCHQPSVSAICQPCLNCLPWYRQGCLLCHAISTSYLCDKCQHELPLHHAITSCYYLYPIQRMITALKYHRQTHWARALAYLLVQRVQSLPRPDILVPVPLHPQKMALRGFNQSFLLAKHAGSMLGVPVVPILHKTKHTPSQTLGKQSRQKHLGFTCDSTSAPHIALIDDVITTGNTAKACIHSIHQTNPLSLLSVWAIAKTQKQQP